MVYYQGTIGVKRFSMGSMRVRGLESRGPMFRGFESRARIWRFLWVLKFRV